jgi:hypothetical protein
LQVNRRPKMAFQHKPESVTLQNTHRSELQLVVNFQIIWLPVCPTKQSSGTFILKSPRESIQGASSAALLTEILEKR